MKKPKRKSSVGADVIRDLKSLNRKLRSGKANEIDHCSVLARCHLSITGITFEEAETVKTILGRAGVGIQIVGPGIIYNPVWWVKGPSE